ncbi:Ku protein [Streptomyces sp. CC210A]|uniref:non-homologous end joining protein Ku n=1 Tax=Streptomyces sp. CC210A TaxID=2898184 RepID=UPI001F18D26C|nr:Ku protein [Streptomyces sp. CC210A]
MARAIWSGVLTFGLVTLPVQLFTATEDHTVHFRQVQRGTSDRIRYKRVNERTGEEVGYDDIVKGYDLGGGDYVLVDPDELDEIAPGRSQVVEITGFVDLDQVEPVYFDRTYYLAPGGEEYAKIYDVLRRALDQENKTGVATFVMRGKQHLVALRAQEEVLVLHTLHWADEVRDPHEELPALPEGGEATSRELDSARRLIDALSVHWNPEDYHDTYEERVRELVDAKAEGREVVSGEAPPEPSNVISLMDLLQRSVEQSRAGREQPSTGRGHPERRPAGGKGERSKRRGAAGARGRLEQLSKDELYEQATRRDIAGRSKMNKDQLIEALGRAAS